jgi:hypothetical protein
MSLCKTEIFSPPSGYNGLHVYVLKFIHGSPHHQCDYIWNKEVI